MDRYARDFHLCIANTMSLSASLLCVHWSWWQEYETTVSLCDMGAIDALPWKIVIDEHRRPDNSVAEVNLGLGNDLVLKQDVFYVVLNGMTPMFI